MARTTKDFYYDDVINNISNQFELIILSRNENYLELIIHKKHYIFLTLLSKEKVNIDHKVLVNEDVWFTRKEQVLSRINSLSGLNKKIHARTCIIKQIEKFEAEPFLNQNHLSGYVKCATKIGLYCKDELLAVATFSSGRIMRRLSENERSYELLSYATKRGNTVVGGFDKLVNYFTKLKSPSDIMTYIDKEWGNTNSYEKLGFIIVGESSPITFYVDENYRRHKHNNSIINPVQIMNHGNYKLIKKCIYEI
jgi:hypothetical protein